MLCLAARIRPSVALKCLLMSYSFAVVAGVLGTSIIQQRYGVCPFVTPSDTFHMQLFQPVCSPCSSFIYVLQCCGGHANSTHPTRDHLAVRHQSSVELTGIHWNSLEMIGTR